MSNNLVGIWISDLEDKITQENYGNVTLDFRENGDLIYIITEQDKEQKILMTYRIDDIYLITDQLSHPQEERTEFFIDIENKYLELFFDGIKSKYIKELKEQV